MKSKYKAYLNDLQNLIGYTPSHSDISDILRKNNIDVSANALSNRLFKDGFLKEEEVEILDDYYKANKNLIVKDEAVEKITLDYYPDIDFSCGNGLMPFSETKEKMTIPASLIKGYRKERRYIIVNAKSDSMTPEIKPNDLLIIRMIDTEPIIDNHIYVFCYDARLYCKYLSCNIGQIIARSANENYPVRYIEGEKLNLFKLYGEVVGHFRYDG